MKKFIQFSQESFKTFQNVSNKHAPLKQKKERGNHAPFMTKDLSKAIMNKSKTRNRYLKWPPRENFLTMKNAKNLCNNLIKTNKKFYFQNVTQKGFATMALKAHFVLLAYIVCTSYTSLRPFLLSVHTSQRPVRSSKKPLSVHTSQRSVCIYH